MSGTVGRAWGAPRLRADEVRVLGTREPVAHALEGTPNASTEWRLVRVSGTIAEVHRSGDRWVAELAIGTKRIPVQGLPGSGIPAGSVIIGRAATITGIVKRPYPTATDRRFAIVPRRPSDLVLGISRGLPQPSAAGSAALGSQAPLDGLGGLPGATAAPADVDLRDLGSHIGEQVRVGGLVTDIAADGVHLDDGTATGRIVLEGPAADLASLLQPGDAMNATGIPAARGEVVLVVADPAGIELVGDLGGEAPALAATDGTTTLEPASDDRATVRAAIGQGMGVDPMSASLGTLVLVVALSIGMTFARRHRARRLVRARILERLATVGRATAPAAATGPIGAPGEQTGTQAAP